MEEFIFTDNTRLIAENDGYYIATNDLNATLADIYKLGIMIDSNKNFISPVLYIGSLTKDYGWTPIDEKLTYLNQTKKL